ncbi:MAG: Cof-type HAD-IIB family hydrolase [Chryseolinea sp.]
MHKIIPQEAVYFGQTNHIFYSFTILFYTMIKAICSDIDGTLLNSQRELSDRTITAIRAVKDKVPFILASSRMPSAMTHLQKQLGIEDHPMICYNGGYVLRRKVSGDAFDVLESAQISLAICKKILSLADQCSVHVSLFSRDDWYAQHQDQWTLKEQLVTKVQPTIINFNDVLASWSQGGIGAHKIMCMGVEYEVARLYALLESQLAEDIHIYRSKSTYLELAPRAVSKASALEIIMRKCFNTDLTDVMGFGDNYNDIEMINSVGYGIAVENGLPELKIGAREITTAGNADGVAIVIERYFNLTPSDHKIKK